MDAITKRVGRDFKQPYHFKSGEKNEVITRNPDPVISYKVTKGLMRRLREKDRLQAKSGFR